MYIFVGRVSLLSDRYTKLYLHHILNLVRMDFLLPFFGNKKVHILNRTLSRGTPKDWSPWPFWYEITISYLLKNNNNNK